MNRTMLVVLLAGCGPAMKLPDGVVLPKWGTAGDAIGDSGASLQYPVRAMWTHPTDEDLVLYYTAYVDSPPAFFVADASTGVVTLACSDTRFFFPEPQRPRFHGDAGYWDWDGETLRAWTMYDQIDNCAGLNPPGESQHFDIDAFDGTYAFAEGGFVTWDKGTDSLVRLTYDPLVVQSFGALPTPEWVALRRDGAGLWAVVHDEANATLAVYEVDAATQSVDLRMTVPVGGAFVGVEYLDSGVLVWKTDTSSWGAAVAAGGQAFQLDLPEPPGNGVPWDDGKGFLLAPPGPVSVNLTNGRVYNAGVALSNGMHVTLEETAPDAVTVSWTGNTAEHGPDDGVFASEVLDVAVAAAPDGVFTSALVAEAFANGACVVGRDNPGQGLPAGAPDPWVEGVHTWYTNASALFAGPCGGPMRPLASGMDAWSMALPEQGPMLVALEGISVPAVDTYDPLFSAWAIDPSGSPQALFRSAHQFVGPGPSGMMWSVDEDYGLWRVDATRWLE